MKLNNKGFAVSGVMYALLILAVSLMFGILSVLVSRKMTLDKIKDNVKEKVNGDIIYTPSDYIGIISKNYAVGEEISYAGLTWQVILDHGSSVTMVLKDSINIGITSPHYANYKDSLNNWLKSNATLNNALNNNYIELETFSDNTNTYSDYVRPLSIKDIYGIEEIPTNLSINTSIIGKCSFCASTINYTLLEKLNGTTSYMVAYDAASKVNYVKSATSESGLSIRPVITIIELNVE